jgi:predicted DNA binding CopG/RHH family protein
MNQTITERSEAEGQREHVNVRIPSDLHRQLKIKCAVDGLALHEAATLAIQRYLTARPS